MYWYLVDSISWWFFREHWDVNEKIRHFGSLSNCGRKKRCRTHEWQSCKKNNSRTISSALFTKLISPIFQSSFDQNNTQPDNDIYVNNTHDVSEENDNSDLDYSKEENDENKIINADDQLSEAEITSLGELYKITEKSQKKQHNIFPGQIC